ncbi:hypothetical protein AALO_G00146520 [Alosa alosa]|uniref:Uncharacterized protein n=1 Tax=Alosa alosa TaxID=278164 RepID=A0AAV6GNF6_9TELE|nr:hypothetical protein AALO_G00146520 [Alosa alosa]
MELKPPRRRHLGKFATNLKCGCAAEVEACAVKRSRGQARPLSELNTPLLLSTTQVDSAPKASWLGEFCGCELNSTNNNRFVLVW